jgi:hypothetical protein
MWPDWFGTATPKAARDFFPPALSFRGREANPE